MYKTRDRSGAGVITSACEGAITNPDMRLRRRTNCKDAIQDDYEIPSNPRLERLSVLSAVITMASGSRFLSAE